MTLPVPTQAGVMIVGTVIAAAGLNLGVLGLVAPEPTEAPADQVEATADGAAASDGVEVNLTSGDLALEPEGPGAPAQIVASAVTTKLSEDDSLDGDDYDDDDDFEANEDDDTAATDPAPTTAAPTTAASTTAAPTTAASTTAAPTLPAPTTAAPTTAAPTTAAPTTAAPTTAAPTTAAPTSAPPPGTELLTYEFDGVATIIIALNDDDELALWSVTKEPGVVHQVDKDEPDRVKLKFLRLSSGEESEFEVKFDEDGDLKVKMER